MPRCFGASGSVRVRRMQRFDRWAPLGPDLRAVDHVVVAVGHGGALQRGQVRPRPRLAEPLTVDVLARPYRGQDLLPLRLRAMDHHRRRDEVDPGGEVALRRAVVRLLLVVDHLVEDGEAPAAVLRRPRHRQPAAFDESGGEVADQPPVLVLEVGVGVDAAPPLGQRLAQEAPHLEAEVLLLLGKAKLHTAAPTLGTARF